MNPDDELPQQGGPPQEDPAIALARIRAARAAQQQHPPQEDPAIALAKIRAARAAKKPEKMLTVSKGSWSHSLPPDESDERPGGIGIPRPDFTQLTDENEAGPVTHALNAAQGLYGMKQLEARAGQAGSNIAHLFDPSQPKLSYEQSLKLLEEQQEKIPWAVRKGEQLMGGMYLTPGLTPFKGAQTAKEIAKQTLKNSAVTGSVSGAADAALDATPTTWTQRGINTGIGTVIGGATGAALSKLGEAIKPRWAAAKETFKGWREGNPAAMVNRAKEVGDEAVSAAFRRAFAGFSKERTQAMEAIMNDPMTKQVVGEISDDLRTRGIHPDSPEFYDEIFKSVSAKPPPTTAARQGDARARTVWKERFLRALETPGEKPAVHLEIGDRSESSPRVPWTVEPQIVPGRDPQTGHVMEGTAGRARGEQAQVAVDPSGRSHVVSPRDVQGPAGPAFGLREQTGSVRPGIEVGPPSHQWEPDESMLHARSVWEQATGEGRAKFLGVDPQKVSLRDYVSSNRPWSDLTLAERTRAAQAMGYGGAPGGQASQQPWQQPSWKGRVETAPAEQIPAMMEGYREPVELRTAVGKTERAHARALAAATAPTQSGKSAVLGNLKAMLNRSPEGLRRWAERASPKERDDALEMLRRVQAEQTKFVMNPWKNKMLGGTAGALALTSHPVFAGAAILGRGLAEASKPGLYEAVRPTAPVNQQSLLAILRAMNVIEQTATNDRTNTGRGPRIEEP